MCSTFFSRSEEKIELARSFSHSFAVESLFLEINVVVLPSTSVHLWIVWKTLPHLSVYCICSISLRMNSSHFKFLYWIVQVDSSASHHHRHWCAKWNSTKWIFASMHIAEQCILCIYCRYNIKYDRWERGQARLYWNHKQNYLFTLNINCWTIFAPYAYVWKQTKKTIY